MPLPPYYGGTGAKAPYRSPFQPPADLGLPFDPNQVTPFSPEELQGRQPLIDASTSLQDALSNQAQVAQGPTGLAGIISSPLFQAAVPTALTALSAVFPRHMAVAGPVGMAGYRSVMDANQNMQQTARTTAADVAKQRLQDFNRQSLKYKIHHSDIDPSAAQGLDQLANVDDVGAAKGFEEALKTSGKMHAYEASLDHPRPLGMGEKETLTNPVTGQTTTRGGGPEPSFDFVILRKDPNYASLTDSQLITKLAELRRDPNQRQEYSDYYAGMKKKHPDWTDDQIAANYKLIQPEYKTDQETMTAEELKKAWKSGLLPLPTTIGTRMNPQILKGMAELANEGINVRAMALQQQADRADIQALHGEAAQKARQQIRTVDGLLDNILRYYDAWEPYATKYKVGNKMGEALATNFGDGNMATAAAQLKASMAEAVPAMSNMFQGGAGTNETNRAAQAIIDPALPPHQFRAVINAAKMSTAVRQWAYNNPQSSMLPDQYQGMPDQRPTPQPAPSPGGSSASGSMSQDEAEAAHSAGKLSDKAFVALVKKNGWKMRQ